MLVALVAAVLFVGLAVQAKAAKLDSGSVQAAGGAPGPISEESSTASASGEGSTVTATASCPPGTKVVGGGFDAPYSVEVIGLVYESVKSGGRRWRSSAQVLDPGAPTALTLTTYAYCRSHAPRAKTRSVTAPTTGETEVGPTVPARCNPGESALAGGFTMPAPLRSGTVTALYLDSARSGTSAWDVRVITGPAAPSTVTSEAYCSRRAGAPAESVATSAPNGGDFTPSSATAGCPAGLTPAAGGFSQPDSGPISFFIVYESRRVGDGWRISGLHSGNEPASTLRAVAYCA